MRLLDTYNIQKWRENQIISIVNFVQYIMNYLIINTLFAYVQFIKYIKCKMTDCTIKYYINVICNFSSTYLISDKV